MTDMTDETKGDGMTLEDRVEFALRDAGFDYDEASRIAQLAAQSAKIDVSPDFPLGAIENGRVFADRLEQTDLSCVAGDLHLCVDWHEFRRCFEYMAEWCMGQAAQSAMRVDELLDASEALVLALGKRGIHISFYDAKAALQAAIGGQS